MKYHSELSLDYYISNQNTLIMPITNLKFKPKSNYVVMNNIQLC